MTLEAADPGPADGWQQLDPRKIELDRIVGWIVTAVVSGLWFIGASITALVADDAWILGIVLLIAWFPVTAGVAFFCYRWPPLEYRYSRYRVDDEVIQIESGVVWRRSVVVPRSRVQTLDVTQGPIQRRYGLGVLSIYTAGTEHSLVPLAGISHEVAVALRDRLLPRESRADGV